MNFREKLFLKHLYWRTRPSLVEKFLKGQKIRSGKPFRIDRRHVRVGAAQVRIKLVKNPLDYVEEMHGFVREASGLGVQLLVFPEYNYNQLFGLLPGIESMSLGDDGGGTAFKHKILDLLFFLAPPFVQFAYTVFSRLAGEYGIYIMAGSFPTATGDRVTNRAVLFAPDGTLLGSQDKIHLTLREHKEGLSAGHRFEVCETGLGRLAMPVCMDATYFETFRILSAKGAEIVMLPIADPQRYNCWLALRGIWPRVQESLVYGIKAALVGEFLGEPFTGKAGVFAPLELTPGRDGVLAEAPGHDREALVTAELDLEALQELRANHPYLGDRNPELERRYFPSIYDRSKPGFLRRGAPG